MAASPDIPAPARRNRLLAARLLGIVALSFAFGFALVPLYDVLCAATGLNGRTSGPGSAAATGSGDPGRVITIEFTDTVMPGLPWTIVPQTTRLDVHPGELHQVTYRVHNRSDRAIVGQAIPSVSPGIAAPSFSKLECFCFRQQALDPGETKELPLVFTVKSDIDKDVRTITLAYAFFNVDDAGTASKPEQP